MDRKTIKKTRENLKNTAVKEGFDLERITIFGSRARKDYGDRSDVDILIVSDYFKEMKNYKRPKIFYRNWNYRELPDPEFICLTPNEFEEKRKKKPHIVRTALEEGVSVT